MATFLTNLSVRRSSVNTSAHLLCDLHWLRVPQRILYRLAVLVFHRRHNRAPPYLAYDLRWTDEAEVLQRLRSGSRQRLIMPRMRLHAIGDRSFRVTATQAWNGLPVSVAAASSV